MALKGSINNYKRNDNVLIYHGVVVEGLKVVYKC